MRRQPTQHGGYAMKVWVEIEVQVDVTSYTPERRGRRGAWEDSDPDEPAEVEFEIVSSDEDLRSQIMTLAEEQVLEAMWRDTNA